MVFIRLLLRRAAPLSWCQHRPRAAYNPVGLIAGIFAAVCPNVRLYRRRFENLPQEANPAGRSIADCQPHGLCAIIREDNLNPLRQICRLRSAADRRQHTYPAICRFLAFAGILHRKPVLQPRELHSQGNAYAQLSAAWSEAYRYHPADVRFYGWFIGQRTSTIA